MARHRFTDHQLATWENLDLQSVEIPKNYFGQQ